MQLINLENLEKNLIIKFNKIYLLEKKKYIKFLTFFLIKQNIFRGFSTFFSRNNDETLTYRLYCLAILLKKELKKNKKYKLITNDYIKFIHLKNNLKNKNLYIIYKGRIISKILFYLKYLKILLRFVKIFIYLYYEIVNKSYARKNFFILKKKIILLDTTFLPSSFNNNNYSDRFYGNKFNNFKNIYFLPENLLFSKTRSAIKILKRKKIKFILKSDFLSFSDYLWALKVCFNPKIKYFSKFKFLNGIDIRFTQKIDLLSSIGNFNYFIGLLNYKFFERLNKEKANVKSIINWNENQSADKGFVLGAKTFFSQIIIKGYCGYFVNYDYFFNRQPLKIEKLKNYIPDILFVSMTKYFKKIKIFCPEVKFSLAPLLRFRKFHTDKLNCNQKKNYILVVLPIERSEIKNLLNMLKLIDTKKNKILINFHPDYSDHEKKEIIKKNSHQKYKFIEKSFYSLINKSKIVISTSSSATIEALLRGKLIISPVNSNFLIDTPLIDFAINKNYKIVYNAEHMLKVVKLFSKATYKSTKIKKLKDELFNRRNYSTKKLIDK